MKPDVDVALDCEAWAGRIDPAEVAARAVAATTEQVKPGLHPDAEVSIVFSDDATVRELNRTWRSQDRPTNVLAFPASGEGALDASPLLGDVILAFQTVEREAKEQGKSFADHATHLVVHGFLHLLGYDHIEEAEAEEMESCERRILARLNIADPYDERPAARSEAGT